MKDVKDKDKDNGANTSSLRRASSSCLDEILGIHYPLLDHGFLRVIDYMGNDAAIVQAARVSYGAGTKTLREDESLISYLLRHAHTSPFEMCVLKIHVKMPVFVARQWIRHRTASVNEYSARYSVLANEFYRPDAKYRAHKGKGARSTDSQQQTIFGDKLTAKVSAQQSQDNKQGRDEKLTLEETQEAYNKMLDIQNRSYNTYQRLLGSGDENSLKNGVARELARTILPVGVYTELYWSINLHNLLHFLALRCDKHAQYEIRVYADCIKNEILPRWLPLVAAAFEEYGLGGVRLQKSAVKVVRQWLKGEMVTQEESGMSEREWKDLHNLLGVADGS